MTSAERKLLLEVAWGMTELTPRSGLFKAIDAVEKETRPAPIFRCDCDICKLVYQGRSL